MAINIKVCFSFKTGQRDLETLQEHIYSEGVFLESWAVDSCNMMVGGGNIDYGDVVEQNIIVFFISFLLILAL